MKQLRINQESGVIMVSLMAFIAIIAILAPVVVLLGVQSKLIATRQNYTQQAQLASVTAFEHGKEQYELDIDYVGTSEETLYSDDRITVTYEVVHQGYTNGAQTQQDIAGIGRVYITGEADPQVTREVRGRITRDAGSGSAIRFIFVVDNSGSMSITEWNQSKGTVDTAIQYVIDNVPTAEVAVVQYGTNHYSHEHKYDVTIPFTNDRDDAVNWGRRYGHGTTATDDFQDYLAASLARMRVEGVYGAGFPLDLDGATDVQFVLFTDAWGIDYSGCCSALAHEPSTSINTSNGGSFTTGDDFDEFNLLKDGTVFTNHGYSGITSQWTVLNVNPYNYLSGTYRKTLPVSAAIASPGGTWNGSIESNPSDPEGDGTLPRRYINTSLVAGPTEILEVLDEIIQEEFNY